MRCDAAFDLPLPAFEPINHCLSLAFSLPFLFGLFTAFPLAFHCLSLAFHCLSLTFPRPFLGLFTAVSFGLSTAFPRPSHCIFLAFPLPFIPLPFPRPSHCRFLDLPTCPLSTPPVRSLARRCMAAEPSRRPSAWELLSEITAHRGQRSVLHYCTHSRVCVCVRVRVCVRVCMCVHVCACVLIHQGSSVCLVVSHLFSGVGWGGDWLGGDWQPKR